MKAKAAAVASALVMAKDFEQARQLERITEKQ